MEEFDYSKTLNLPKTDFSMRANLPQKEPEMVKKWDSEGLYEQLMEENKGKIYSARRPSVRKRRHSFGSQFE